MKIIRDKMMGIDHCATGADVRTRSEDRRLTLREVATEAGITLGYLSDLECGQRKWSIELFNNITEAIVVAASKKPKYTRRKKT